MAAVGVVKSITGQAMVVNERGERHILKVGEKLQAGQQVVTGPGSTVNVQLANGKVVDLAAAQTIKVTQDLVRTDVPDAGENAVNQATIQSVIQAVAEGRDINEILSAPAAGPNGFGGSDGNATFVNLERIQFADPNPNQYGFGTVRDGNRGDVDNRGNDDGRNQRPLTLSAKLDPASDTGSSNSDGLTNDPTPTIIGTGTPGATVTVVTPKETITTTVATNGTWSVTPNTPIPDGPQVIKVTTTLPGNPNTVTADVPLTIDTKSPDLTVKLDPVSDSGTPGDGITNDNTPTISGTGEPKATIEVTMPVTGEKLTTTVGDDGKWSVTPKQPIPDGKDLPVTVVAKDPAGNPTTTTVPLTIDTKSPDLTAKLDPTSDSGTKGDGITNDTTPTIIGTGEPGAKIEVTMPGTGEKIPTTVALDGTWSVTPTQPIPDGTTGVAKVVETDPAGNPTTKDVPLTIDTGIPNGGLAPTVLITDDGDNDGFVNLAESKLDGNTVTDVKIAFDPTKVNVGDTVVVTSGGVTKEIPVTAADKAAGFVTTSYPSPVDGASIKVDAFIKDVAGNNSATGTDQAKYDLSPLDGIKVAITEDANDDNFINATELKGTIGVEVTLPASAVAGDLLKVTGTGNTPQTITLTEAQITAGKLTLEFTAPASGTKFEVSAQVSDPVGNKSPVATDFATIATDPVGAPIVRITEDADDNSYINASELKGDIDTTVELPATAKAGDKLIVTVNGVDQPAITLTDADIAAKTLPIPGITSPGEGKDITIGAHIVDAAGNVGPTGSDTATVDTTVFKGLAIEITEDTNNDKFINATELQGNTIGVRVTLPAGAVAGDTLTVTASGNTDKTITITDAQLTAGFIDIDFTPTGNNTDFVATASIKDLAGNTAGPVSDQATIQLTVAGAPIVTIAEDKNDNSYISKDELNGPIDVSITLPSTANVGDSILVKVNGVEQAPIVLTLADIQKNSVSVPNVQNPGEGKDLIVTAQLKDVAGNISPEGTDKATIDTVTSKPTIDKIIDDFGPVKADLATGATADDATPTLVGKAEAASTVTVFDGAKEIGTTKADANGDWTFTPSPDIGRGLHNYTVTATDKAGNASVPSDNFAYTLNQGPVIGDPDAGNAVVSEEGLLGGLKDTAGTSDKTDSATYQGDLKISDPNGDAITVTLTAPTTTYTSNGVTITWSGSGTSADPLIGSAAGNEVVRATIDNTGKYNVVLSGAVDHPNTTAEDTLIINIGVNAKDSSTTTTGTITLTVEDDAPVAVNQVVTASGYTGTNLLFTIDTSGSMGTLDGIDGKSRLASEIASINTLIDKYAALGETRIMIVSFADCGKQLSHTWMTVSEAKAALADLTAGGSTNYDDAVHDTKAAFAAAGRLAGAQNVGYFFSDGAPTVSDGIKGAEITDWENFLNTNQIKQFAIGLGAGATDTMVSGNMNQLAYNGQSGTDTNAVKVSDFNKLDSVLSDTVPKPVTGNLTTGVGFGGDGGFVKSLNIDGTTYTFDNKTGKLSVTGSNNSTYNSSTHEITINTSNGKIVVDMDNGAYSFQAKSIVNSIGATVVADSVEMQQNDTTSWESPPVMTALADGRFMAVWVKDGLSDDTKSMQVWGRIFNADGSPSTNEFRVGKLAADGSDGYDVPNLTINQLEGGNVVVQWVRNAAESWSQDTPVFTIINPQTAGTNPTTVIQDVVMRDPSNKGVDSPAVVETLADGRFIAVWTENGLSDDITSMKLQARIFNADGTPSTGQFQVGNWAVDGTDCYDVANWNVTQLANGNIIVGYIRNFAEAGNDSPVFTVLDKNGNTLQANVIVEQTDNTTRFDSPPVIESLTDGRFIAIWTINGLHDDTTAMKVMARIFNADGTASTNEFQVGTKAIDGFDGYDVEQMTVKQLANGNIVVGYVRNTAEDGKDAPIFTLLDKNGKTLLADVSIEQAESATRCDSPPVMEALQDGRFIAVWTLNGWTDDVPTMKLMARVFNADGSPSTSEFQVGTKAVDGSDGYDVPNVTVTQLANGNVVVAWERSFAEAGGDEPIYSVIKIDPIPTGSVDSTKITYTLSDNDGDTASATLTLGSANKTVHNLIVNGSFEDVTGLTKTLYGYVGNAAIPGWNDTRGLELDVHTDNRGGVKPTDGIKWLDLEATPGNNLVGQNVQGVTTGEIYKLSFSAGDIANANDNKSNDNAVTVYWGGVKLGTINPTDGSMSQYEFILVGGAGNGNNRLEFEGGGQVANIGVSIDNVTLVSISDKNYSAAGDENNNILSATSGNDIISGGAGDDIISGDAGNDILIGGKGNDILSGGVSVDVFRWAPGDEGLVGNQTIDTIKDFDNRSLSQGGDVLDIRDLLQGENDNNLTNYLHFEKSGADTIVHISSTGGFAGGFQQAAENQKIVVLGVDLTAGQTSDAAIIANMMAQQKLITD